MPFLAECAAVASQLPKLEPLAGAGLAVNLAYLNLERFRYGKVIRSYATEKLDRFNRDFKFSGGQLLGFVAHLASLPDHDGFRWPWSKSPVPVESAKWPNEPPAVTYRRLFQHHFDVVAAALMAAACGGLLSLGVAHDIDYLDSVSCGFAGGWADFVLYLLVLCMVVPLFMVRRGDRCVRWAKGKVDENLSEVIGIIMQREAQALSSQNPPPATPPTSRSKPNNKGR